MLLVRFSCWSYLDMMHEKIIKIDIGLGVAMSVYEVVDYFESQSDEPLTDIDKESIREMFKTSLIKILKDN